MKKGIFLFVLLAQSAFATNTSTCYSDYYEMKAQIANYGSITSPVDHQVLNDVGQPTTQADVCYADGFKGNYKFCVLKWKKGLWGYTFRCDL